MSEPWHYQIRVYLDDRSARLVGTDDPAIGPLMDILRRHDAIIKSQYDAFAAYVAEAETKGCENYPLYAWTKATLADGDRAAQHKCSFAVRVGGQEVYAKEIADLLEAELRPLVGGPLVMRLSRHDTNPANNMPVPAEYR